MTKYVIFGRLGPADAFRPPRAVDTVATTLDLLDAAGSLRFGVDRALKHLAGWHLTPTAVGIDLITLAAHVHAADTRLNRVQASQDGWMREISIVVPVSDVAVWDRATAPLERMLRFLTGDLWAVRFRPCLAPAARLCRVSRDRGHDIRSRGSPCSPAASTVSSGQSTNFTRAGFRSSSATAAKAA